LRIELIFLAVLFFTLLGVTYVKGYDVVKRRSPEHLVHFYLVMATIRMLLVATVVGIYVFFAPNREEAIHFAAIILIMYAITMVVTLSMRH
jgi:cytochrome c biogenesis factor